jgi:hypothetical protein
MQVFTPLQLPADAAYSVPVYVFQKLSLKANWGGLLRKHALVQPPRQLLQQSVAPHDASKYREPHASVVLRHAGQRPNTAPARYSSCERSHAAVQQLQHARPRTSPQQSCAKPLRTPSGVCRVYLRPLHC